MQSCFLKDMKHVLATFDVASGEYAFQKFKESRFSLITI